LAKKLSKILEQFFLPKVYLVNTKFVDFTRAYANPEKNSGKRFQNLPRSSKIFQDLPRSSKIFQTLPDASDFFSKLDTRNFGTHQFIP